jgi:D-aminopeptidase
MKVYISVDIEGVAGITDWNEAEKAHADLRTISPKALFPCPRASPS